MSAAQLHPTAVVAPGAVLGDDCVVGPYCIVGEHVVLGPRTRLLSHVVLDGHTRLGADCQVYPFASLGTQTQDLKFKGEVSFVEIGDRNVIREYVTIHAATAGGCKTVVGDGCLIQAYCHVAHDSRLGNGIIMSSGAKLAGHVEIDDAAVIGGMTGIIQFTKIGTMAMVGAYSKLDHDVPPYCIADGLPAELRAVNRIGMERHGKSPEAIQVMRHAFRRIFRAGLTLEKALDELTATYPDSPEIAALRAFAARSTRGICRPRAAEAGSDGD